MERRELPTHLHVEDKLIAGLTIRQVLFLCVGVSVGYSLWLHLAGITVAVATWLTHTSSLAMFASLAQVARLVISAGPVLLMVICVLVRPADRPLEDWLLVTLRYLSLPKTAVWRSSAHDAMLQATLASTSQHRMTREPEQGALDADDEGMEWSDADGSLDKDDAEDDAEDDVNEDTGDVRGDTPEVMNVARDGPRRTQHAQGGW